MIQKILADDYVLDDLLLGGDASVQGAANNRLQCYGVAALPAAGALDLAVKLEQLLTRFAHALPGKYVELHAKSIWNGNERSKGPFRALQSKDAMKSFVLDVCNVIRSTRTLISVAFAHESTFPKRVLAEQHPATPLSTALKRELIMSALNRLDDNLAIVTGKHIGRAKFLLDRETDQVFQSEKGRATGGRGFSTWSHIAYDKHDQSLPDKTHVYTSLDPVYSYHNSESSRLIQVADLATYFVGKYILLVADVLESTSYSSEKVEARSARLHDLAFCLSVWDTLNLEVVLLVDYEQAARLPEWLLRVLRTGWRDPFAMEATRFEVVLREAMRPRPYNFDPRIAWKDTCSGAP